MGGVGDGVVVGRAETKGPYVGGRDGACKEEGRPGLPPAAMKEGGVDDGGVTRRREIRAEARRDLDVTPNLLEGRLGLGLIDEAEGGRDGDVNDAEDQCPMGGDEGHGFWVRRVRAELLQFSRTI